MTDLTHDLEYESIFDELERAGLVERVIDEGKPAQVLLDAMLDASNR